MPRASLSAPAQRAPRQRLPRSSGLPAAGLQATDFPGRTDRNADSCRAVRSVAFVFPGKARGSRVLGFSGSRVLWFPGSLVLVLTPRLGLSSGDAAEHLQWHEVGADDRL